MSAPISSPSAGPLMISASDAGQYLETLDVKLEDVLKALQEGLVARGNVSSKYFPTIAPGMQMWIQMVRALREGLDATENWSVENERNRPSSKHPTRDLTVSVAGADEAAGDPTREPKASRALGPETQKIAEENKGKGGTMPLIPIGNLIKTKVSEFENSATAAPDGNWFLLYFFNGQGLQAEFSLPNGAKGGDFTGWKVRVMLPGYDPVAGGRGTESENDLQMIDVGGQEVEFAIEDFGEGIEDAG